MDYFTDVLATFCTLIVVITLLSMEGQSALIFNKKYIFICALKMNGLTPKLLRVMNDMRVSN